MRNKLNIIIAVICCLAVFSPAVSAKEKEQKKHSEDSQESVVVPDTELIDVPTAGVLDYYGFQVKSRFVSNGGLLGGVGFGVLPRLNLGATMLLEQMIGTDSSVQMVSPAIQAKYRFYDGTAIIPAFALGYDGQGYYYNHDTKKYQEKARGLYVAGSQEIFCPNLMFHPGVNVSDFDSGSIYMFAGLNFVVKDSFSLMLEWDNIQRFDESRVNSGVRFYVTPFFHLDFAVRDIGLNRTFENGERQKPERIVQVKYTTSF